MQLIYHSLPRPPTSICSHEAAVAQVRGGLAINRKVGGSIPVSVLEQDTEAEIVPCVCERKCVALDKSICQINVM